MVDSQTKITFTAGIFPCEIESLGTFSAPIAIGAVRSSLEVTWYSPTRHIRPLFHHEEHAEQAVKFFNGREHLGVRLACSLLRSKAKGDFVARLSNITVSFSREHLHTLLNSLAHRPFTYCFEKLSYKPLANPTGVLSKMISNINDCKVTASKLLSTQNRIKSRASSEFDGTSNLSKAAERLNDQKIAAFGGTRIHVAERIEASFTISQQTFQRHGNALKGLLGKNARRLHINAHIDERSEPVAMTLSGTSRKDMIKAMSTVYDLVRAGLRHDFENLQTARRKQPAQTHRIRLTKTMAYRQVVSSGLARAQYLFGDDAVKLDEASNPPAVIVRGDTATLRKVKSALLSPLPETTTASDTDCCICLENLEEKAVIPECGHACCSGCLREYCLTAGEGGIPLQCFTSGCAELLSVKAIRDHVSEPDFMLKLRQAVKGYQKHHTNEYIPCPELDCDAYSPTNSVAGTHTCPSCFVISCTSCKVPHHFGETCEQYKLRISEHEEEFEEWKEREMAKSCPQCGTVIQRDRGCGHMECGACHTHFCWVCLTIGANSREVYRHMLDTHGDYGDEQGVAGMHAVDEAVAARRNLNELLQNARAA